MTRPYVELTEEEASLVLSNWPSPACVMFWECFGMGPDAVASNGRVKNALSVLHSALHRGSPRTSRDRLASCIRVVPRRRS